jgi:hypothetical protein
MVLGLLVSACGTAAAICLSTAQHWDKVPELHGALVADITLALVIGSMIVSVGQNPSAPWQPAVAFLRGLLDFAVCTALLPIGLMASGIKFPTLFGATGILLCGAGLWQAFYDPLPGLVGFASGLSLLAYAHGRRLYLHQQEKRRRRRLARMSAAA